MPRAVRIYLLAVALPAVLLVALGIRLVVLEGGRSRQAAVTALNKQAKRVARQIKAELNACPEKRGGETHSPPKPPPAPRPRSWWKPRRSLECTHHDIPAPYRRLIEKVVAASNASGVVEVRHGCGCVVAGGSVRITGKIYGKADLHPYLHDYVVCVAPRGGDAEIALGVRMQIAVSTILFILMCAGLSAGVAILVKDARKAREEVRKKTDFLSNVSHELKTPLTSITLFSEMLSSGALDAAAMQKAASTIAAESKRLARHIDSLLEYARLERGARKFSIEEVELDEIVRAAAEAFAPSFPNGLEVECAGARVKADREALRRIVDCLLENAAKYAASEAPVKICAKDGVLVVEDSGPGMSSEEAKHAFERFWRADNSVTRPTGGAGLGLAIARELAHGMGAELSLEHVKPHGCRFKIAFAYGRDTCSR